MSESPFEPYRPEHGRPDDGPRPSSAAPPWPPSPYPSHGVLGYGYGGYAPRHPQATTILVLGIVSLFVSILGPVAWVMGNRAKAEIEASGGRLDGLSEVNTGRIIGICMTVVLVVSIVMVLFVLALVAGIIGAST